MENKVEAESIIVRESREGDIPFILASFLKGLFYGDSWFSLVPKAIFMEKYHAVLEALLANPATVTKVACLKSDPDTIVGYAIFGFSPPDNRCLHWVYCKKAWRNTGVAKLLIPVSEINTVTHLTRTGVSILYNHPKIVFNPFVLV